MAATTNGRVQGKVCLVTGAAMGLGEAMARTLAREGGRIVLTDLDEPAGQAGARAIADAGGEALFLHQDVTREDRWAEVIEEALRHFGRLDVLVNNAGIGYRCDPETQTLDEWRRLMAINLEGVFLGTKHAIPAMRRNAAPAGGSIINISSIEGLVGDPTLGAYNASKGGVTLYTRSVALYCAQQRTGIRVNSIHPGYIVTPMLEKAVAAAVAADGDGDGEARLAELAALHPVGHLGEPMDIAWGVVYLAADESKFVTGAALVIDGGYTAQ